MCFDKDLTLSPARTLVRRTLRGLMYFASTQLKRPELYVVLRNASPSFCVILGGVINANRNTLSPAPLITNRRISRGPRLVLSRPEPVVALIPLTSTCSIYWRSRLLPQWVSKYLRRLPDGRIYSGFAILKMILDLLGPTAITCLAELNKTKFGGTSN